VLVTGVTGFVGEALLHLMLSEVPEVRMSVLVRPKGSTSGADRIAKLLEKPIFAGILEAAGGIESLMAARIAVVEGDLADVPALPTDIDAVVHCAGDVSFDPPVDEGFTTNVVGTRDLLDRIDQAREEGGRDIHYVHISTAYVAGRRRGHIPEGPVDHDVDLDAELEWGLGQRRLVEARSRDVDILGKERKKAEREHGRAGLLTAARATEAARKKWVKDELVRIGTERARSLGWTDCYTFTKALGERVVERWAATPHRASIVRPSIIESALDRPHPGWIEGFKMAEPLILAYGRGELPEFPAAGDTTIDIVPVDHVVSAIVAVLAHPPEPGDVQYFHVSSGDRNPLTFRFLYDTVRGYFDAHPFTSGDRGAARLPDWRFPGARSVERLLSTSEKAWKVADYVVGHSPRSDRTRDLARKLHQQGRRLEFLRRYLDLYLEYATAELQFSDKQTMALFESLSPEDRATFAFDTSVIDWHHYLAEVHCPAVTAPVRRLDELRALRKNQSRTGLKPLEPTLRAAQPAERRAQRASLGGTEGAGSEATSEPLPCAAAFFDMDGTLLSSNVIETYLWVRLRELDGGQRLAELGRIASKVPNLVQAERRQRSEFLRAIYREYEGARLADLDAIADEHLASHILSRLSPDAVRRIREHRAAGHHTVLITGAIRPLTRPLRPLFDHIEAADLAVDARGVCTGFLAASPLVGESRAAWMRSYAEEHGIDMKASYAYADSHSDLPLLEAVGNPVAVRPDVPLYRHARRSHWDVVDWASPSGSVRGLDPAGDAR
jgi:HAD superfamily hydrolase (TIGR01490 family)